MGKKKASSQPVIPDYTALNEQKLRELEEADKYRREQAARRNNTASNGRSILSWGARGNKK